MVLDQVHGRFLDQPGGLPVVVDATRPRPDRPGCPVIPAAASAALLTTQRVAGTVGQPHRPPAPGPIEGVAIGIPIGREPGPVPEGDDPLVGGQPGGVGGHRLEGRRRPPRSRPVGAGRGPGRTRWCDSGRRGTRAPRWHPRASTVARAWLPSSSSSSPRHAAAPHAEPRGSGPVGIDGEDSGVLDDQVEDHPPGEEDGWVGAAEPGFEGFSAMP